MICIHLFCVLKLKPNIALVFSEVLFTIGHLDGVRRVSRSDSAVSVRICDLFVVGVSLRPRGR